MKTCCGEVPYTNYSLRTGYSMYCTICHKSLTACYAQGDEAEFVWVHGPEDLPARCPFCCMPARIVDPMSETPRFGCQLTSAKACPIGGQLFPVGAWPRVQCWNTERLANRWAKRPEFRKALRALKVAVELDKRGRFLSDPKQEPCRKPSSKPKT